MPVVYLPQQGRVFMTKRQQITMVILNGNSNGMTELTNRPNRKQQLCQISITGKEQDCFNGTKDRTNARR